MTQLDHQASVYYSAFSDLSPDVVLRDMLRLGTIAVARLKASDRFPRETHYFASRTHARMVLIPSTG